MNTDKESKLRAKAQDWLNENPSTQSHSDPVQKALYENFIQGFIAGHLVCKEDLLDELQPLLEDL